MPPVQPFASQAVPSTQGEHNADVRQTSAPTSPVVSALKSPQVSPAAVRPPAPPVSAASTTEDTTQSGDSAKAGQAAAMPEAIEDVSMTAEAEVSDVPLAKAQREEPVVLATSSRVDREAADADSDSDDDAPMPQIVMSDSE